MKRAGIAFAAAITPVGLLASVKPKPVNAFEEAKKANESAVARGLPAGWLPSLGGESKWNRFQNLKVDNQRLVFVDESPRLLRRKHNA